MNKPARDLQHPVWDVYDLLRTSRLNAKYFSCRVTALKTYNFWIEIVLATTATGSALAALAFWSTEIGKPVWQGLLILSAILAIAKPLLKLTDQIQELQGFAGEFKGIELHLKKIEIGIRQQKHFTPGLKRQFFGILDEYGALAKKSQSDTRLDSKLRDKCQREVGQELPSTQFFIPEE